MAKVKKKKAADGARDRAANLRFRISQIRARRDGTVPAKESVAVIDDILSAGIRINARSRRLSLEIRRLSEFIHAARAGIVTIKTAEVKREFIPTAADELDAIIEATAVIDKVMGTLTGDASAQLMDVTIKIYEACGFQDITGQRITKVVKALNQIEARSMSWARLSAPTTPDARPRPRNQPKTSPQTARPRSPSSTRIFSMGRNSRAPQRPRTISTRFCSDPAERSCD